MKTHLLINPKAGLLKGLTDPAEIKAKLGDIKADPLIVIAEDTEGITAFIEKAKADEAQTVLVAGGDGTIATVIKGLMDTDVTFGIIPTGSMNNIGQSLGLSGELDQAVAVINAGKIGRMDLGRVNGETFIESAGFGLLANIMNRVGEQDSKKEVLRVAAHTIAEVVTNEIIPAYMVIDGGEEKIFNTVWLTVTNTGRAAAALVDPDSSVHDNHLAVVYCEPLDKAEIARYVTAFIRNNHMEEDKFHRLTGRKITIKLPPNIQVHVDGELREYRMLKLEVMPAAIKVFVP